MESSNYYYECQDGLALSHFLSDLFYFWKSNICFPNDGESKQKYQMFPKIKLCFKKDKIARSDERKNREKFTYLTLHLIFFNIVKLFFDFEKTRKASSHHYHHPFFSHISNFYRMTRLFSASNRNLVWRDWLHSFRVAIIGTEKNR